VLYFRARYAFVAVSLVLVAALLYTVLGPARGRPGFTVDEPQQDLGQVVAGKEVTVRFAVRNSTAAAVRIVGLEEC